MGHFSALLLISNAYIFDSSNSLLNLGTYAFTGPSKLMNVILQKSNEEVDTLN